MPRQKRHADRVYQQVGEPGPGTWVAGYARYSSEMQDPVSIITQKRHIQEFADKRSWTIVRWYEEPERSAKYEEIELRPVFAQLLAEAGAEFQAVVCYMNNRWARNAAVAFTSLSQLRRKRVWWATSDGLWNIDRVQQDGFDVAFAVDTQMNATYVRQLSKRTIDGKEDRARAGYHNGVVPFGYARPAYPPPPQGAPSTWKPPRVAVKPDPETFPALVRIGELAAAGWSDAAIADELAGYISITPRFGERALTKDTIASIRRMWFAREFAPGCGHGTIETPSGELVEGKHTAAWSYDLWQLMVQAKAAQYRRPSRGAQKRSHEFSRIIVCSECHRPLRVQNYPSGRVYYRDTSSLRKLSCPAGGYLLVPHRLVLTQFSNLMGAIRLSSGWRDAIAERCRILAGGTAGSGGRTRGRRDDLEAERRRLVNAYSKGYLPEADLDLAMARITRELQTLPAADEAREKEERIAAAVSAGETLTDMASYWAEATAEERRDMVWALLQPEGLVYDLQRRMIAALIPRQDVLPVLALGLGDAWETRTDGAMWWRDLAGQPVIERRPRRPPPTPPALTHEQQLAALEMVRAGKSLREVGARFGVSYGAIWRLTQIRRNPLTPLERLEENM